jgi:signal transduction histidine kinase/ligand-binding sensor domain-containing protein
LQSLRSIAVSGFVLGCFGISLCALDPSKHISQYGHTAWRIQDGFFDGRPESIAQTADGYLWVGGSTQLLRFDGVRFVPWTPPPGKHAVSSRFGRVLAARDGSLWIGGTQGLSHWTHQDLINYSSHGNMQPAVEEEDGTLWVTRPGSTDETGSLCQVRGTAVRCYGKAEGIPQEQYSSSLARDSEGNFWLGSSTSLTRWRQGSSQTYYLRGLKSNIGQPGVDAFAVRPDGSLWVGIANPGRGLGLQQFSDGVWKPFAVPGFDSSKLTVLRLFLDRHNALWVGTFGQGVYRVYDGQVDHFASSDGLSGDTVAAFFEDNEGNLWVATDKGLDRFRDLQIATFSTREGLTSSAIGSVQATRNGAIWMGGAPALDIVGPVSGQGSMRSIQAVKGLPGNQVTSLFEDHAGQHWVGIDNTLNIYENGRFIRITRRDGSPTGMIVGIAEDVQNNLWLLSYRPPRMLIRIFDRKIQEEFPMPPMPEARSLVADPRGGVWLGLTNGDLARYQQGRAETFHFEHPPNSRVNQVVMSSDGSVLGATSYGLIRWSNGTQQTLSTRNGLPCDPVNSLLEDGSGNFWLYMQCGLVEIARNDLQKWWAQHDVRLSPRVFDVFDGLQPGIPAPFESKAVRTLDGRLWFANGSAVQMVDPARLARNSIVPPVQVEQVIADHKGYPPQGDARLPARTRDVEIDYTALSFAVPQKVRFRYRLEGRDTDWQEAGTRRQAFYTDLRPGTYRFHVIACNNDGVWNEEGAILSFVVSPAWYQTNWFKLLFGVVILTTIWALYRLRVRQVARALAVRFDERLAERTRIARELHDTLLQSFQAVLMKFQTGVDIIRNRPDEAEKILERAVEQARQALTEGRDAVQALRSSTQITNDLAQAICAFGAELSDQKGAGAPEFRVDVEGTPRNLAPILRDDLFRTASEAVRNAFQHADATRIEVEICYDQRQLRLLVRDDGKGIDQDILESGERSGHYGLPGLQERAKLVNGKLTVRSASGSGTEIELTIPAAVAYDSPSGRHAAFRQKTAP